MKVCLLTTCFPRHEQDVAGIFVYRIAKFLSREGVKVVVVAPGDENTPGKGRMDGFSVGRFTYFLPRKLQRVAYRWGIPENLRRNKAIALQLPFFMLSYLWAAFKSARGCDLIHAHWVPSGLVGLLVSRVFGKPLVVTVRSAGPARKLVPGLVSKIVLKNASGVITPSLEIQEILRPLGVRASVIPNPIGEDKFRPGIGASSIRMEFGLKESQRVISFISRLSDFKDPVTYLKAVPLVLRKKPDVRFFLVGDGPLRRQLEEMVEQFDLHDRVFLTGMREDTNSILAVSEIFAAVSPFENVWSNTIAEAMQMRVPCILTDVGHTRQVFTHQRNCCLVPPRNPEALAAAILLLLEDPPLRQSLAEQASKLLAEHGRNDSKVIAAHIAMYNKAIGRK